MIIQAAASSYQTQMPTHSSHNAPCEGLLEPDEPLDAPLEALEALEPDEELVELDEADDEELEEDELLEELDELELLDEELDSLTEENDLLEPQNDMVIGQSLLIGIGTPDKAFVGLELATGAIWEPLATEALADAGQAKDQLHGLVWPLVGKADADLASLHDRSDQEREVRHAPTNLDALRLANLQESPVDR